ncbi:MAG: Phytoene synthase [Paracidovorax wautersii]|uniref:Phytoene synthase n=1 Tax=Paracidovorax wautersii TaxID=1177982 RepID=A0A7V8FM34_9BURK|nr:MAG: Phytoene synthase [Paracidovorax wautersii]
MPPPRDEHIQDKAAPPGSSLYYALRFLPADQRHALTTFTAFVREVRGILENVTDAGVANTKLAWWRTEIQRAYDGQTQHPTLQALAPHLQAAAIDARLLLAIVEGTRIDAEQNRFFDYEGLRHYGEHASGIPAEVAARLLGHTHDDTLRAAHGLGLALTLTGVIRDAGRHAAQGRLYLPVDEMQRFGVKAQDVLQRRSSPEFQALMQFQAERALRTFDDAIALLPAADRRAQKPGLILARIARTLLAEIARSDYAVLEQRIALTPLRKFWLAWRTQALG